MNELVSKKNRKTIIQFFRYMVAGSTAFVVDFGTLYLLTFSSFFELHYIAAASIAFVFASVVNYIISIFWVFDNRSIKSPTAEFVIFSIIGLVGLGLNALLIWVFKEKVFSDFISIAPLHYRIAASKICASCIVYFWNFGAKKLILFR